MMATAVRCGYIRRKKLGHTHCGSAPKAKAVGIEMTGIWGVIAIHWTATPSPLDNTSMASARDIADFLLQVSSEEEEVTLITQMHLHKLLYYVQGWSLAMRGQPIFPDGIEAWTHGPVVQSLYSAYRDNVDQPIPVPESQTSLSEEDQDFVKSVWEGYKGYSAGKLRQMTHQESPWILARDGYESHERCNQEISQANMRDFFLSEYQSRAIPGLEPAVLAEAEREFADGGGVPLEEAFAE